MNDNWAQTSLGELENHGEANIQTGPFGTVLKASEYSERGSPVISVGEIRYGYIHVSDKTPKVSDETKERLPQFVLRAGDIVFGRKGAIDRNSIVNENQTGWFLGSDGIRLRLSVNIDSLFVSYQFRCPTIGKWLLQNSSGSVMPSLNQKTLNRLPLWLPSSNEQQNISTVLSTLDKKIALNNKINAELEAMAKLIYDYWFVQFDFPDANGKPYKSSGGKMVYNEALKREVPDGWGDSELRGYLSLEYGKPLKKELRTGVGYPVVGSSGEIGFHSEFLVEGPGIVVGRKGTVGAVTYLNRNFYPIDTTYFVKPKLDIKYLFLKHLLVMLGLTKMNSDSAVPGLNREFTLGIKVVSFPEELIKLFEDRVSPLFDKIAISSEENIELIRLRDWLLPMLMNGQVTVKDS